MNFERIKEYIRESSNRSRFVLTLSLSTVMALAVTTPLAVQAFSADSKQKTLQFIDPNGPSIILTDENGTKYPVPQAVIPLSATISSPPENKPGHTIVKQPLKTIPKPTATTPTPPPPTTTNTGASVTIPVSPTSTVTESTVQETSTTQEAEETTTTQDNTSTTVENTETTIDATTIVAPEPTLTDPAPDEDNGNS